MTEPVATPSRRGARTFRAACLVLASVAAAQAAATAWTSKTLPAEALADAGAGKPEASAGPGVVSVNDPFSPSWVPDDPYPEMQEPAGEAPAEDPALALLKGEPVVTAVKPPAPLDVPITDEGVLADLDEGLYLRSRGDMAGAAGRLRSALQKLPDHPKLLYHAAVIHDMMRQPQKADRYWKALYRLGEGTGDFYIFAKERMADGPREEGAEEEKEGLFTIADLKEEPVTDARGGQRVRFTAVLKRNTKDELDPAKVSEEMLLAPHFFDTVNRRRIARSQVAQPDLECLSQPLDWKEGTETFAFDYWQPEMTAEEIVKFGRCQYFGCTLEVYYREKLQDSTATTPILLQYARELPLPEPVPQESLLEQAPLGPAAGPGGQPESGLFPPLLSP